MPPSPFQSLLIAAARLPRPLRILLTLVYGAVAAQLFQLIHAPLPWMLGPLFCTAVGCMAGAPLTTARPLRNAGQWAIGTALGLYFTPMVMAVLAGHWIAIVAGIAWAITLGAVFCAYLTRANAGNAAIDPATLFFSSAVGGASEMAVLAERHGGRLDLVATAHSLRILLVVALVPLAFQLMNLHGLDPALPGPQIVHWPWLVPLVAVTIASGALMQRIGIANPWMLGPLLAALLLTSNGIVWSALPPGTTSVAQLFIGVALGTRFTPAFLHAAPRWLVSVGLGTLVMIVASCGFALVLAHFTGLHPATVSLGTSPGGIAEMTLTARMLQLGVPVVTAFHVTRMAAVLLLAGPLFRLSKKRAA